MMKRAERRKHGGEEDEGNDDARAGTTAMAMATSMLMGTVSADAGEEAPVEFFPTSVWPTCISLSGTQAPSAAAAAGVTGVTGVTAVTAVAAQQHGVNQQQHGVEFSPTSVRAARSTVGEGFSSTKSREGGMQVHNRARYRAMFHAGEEEEGGGGARGGW
jgi:uncharacterized membrane protein YgcG